MKTERERRKDYGRYNESKIVIAKRCEDTHETGDGIVYEMDRNINKVHGDPRKRRKMSRMFNHNLKKK